MENANTKKCSCNYCETELKNACMSPQFCQPCSSPKNKDEKICPKCGAIYSAKYSKCPSCIE
ncbi:MAG: hypothetical protein LBV16_07325 [Elusimicrobiota bacterium]|nr:hypothetical protein [Elusimicrobiota bacterium]